MAITVGIPKEIYPNERRVAATPDTVQKMRKLGVEVIVEAGAGDESTYADSVYVVGGRRRSSRRSPDDDVWTDADIVLKVRAPMFRPGTTVHEADLMKPGATLISFIWPAQNKELIERMAKRKVTVLAMDAVPRITRAQSMDALSAMANIAGYRAVIEAANCFGRFFPGQVTAAGRVKPAQVFVLGAGVAGLAAIAAARALGAQVRAFDTRAAAREQVESLGAQFVEFKFDEAGEGQGGYAKEMSDAFIAAEKALIAQHAKQSDIIITTALIPGKPAPQLITSGAVVSMEHGSVIVDLAAEQGGNCALTERDKIVEKFGVTIIGLTDLPEPHGAPGERPLRDGRLQPAQGRLRREGHSRSTSRTRSSAACSSSRTASSCGRRPSRPAPRAGGPATPQKQQPKPVHDVGSRRTRPALGCASPWRSRSRCSRRPGSSAPPEFLQHLTVFVLACVIGWHVVWNVTPALHTPLMSVTNAISGIILIGGMVVLLERGASGPALVLGGRGGARRDDQRRGRLPGHATHAEDVPE